MDSKYHLFKRKMLSLDGKEYSVWYYYYWQNGKRIRRPAGHGCRLKREAQRYVEELERKDALRAQSPEQQPIVREPITVSKTIKMPSYRTFGELAETMFLPDSLHLRRQLLADGRGIKEATRLAHRGRLENYILPKWGNAPFIRFTDEGFPDDFQDWLIELVKAPRAETTSSMEPISNSLRNNLIETMSICLREAKRIRLIKSVPNLSDIRFIRGSKRQDTLSIGEINRLFPEDPKELEKLWRRNDPREVPGTGLLFGAMFCLGISAGLRSGELRAISSDQIISEHLADGSSIHGLIVDRAVDSSGEISAKLKKGDDKDFRHRGVLLSEKTMRILGSYLNSLPELPTGPVFLFHGHLVSKELLNARWKVGLKQANIDMSNGRRMTVHAMRYTYNTRMRALVSDQALHEFIGHRSDEMTDLYDKPHIRERLLQLSDQQSAVERFWI